MPNVGKQSPGRRLVLHPAVTEIWQLALFGAAHKAKRASTGLLGSQPSITLRG